MTPDGVGNDFCHGLLGHQLAHLRRMGIALSPSQHPYSKRGRKQYLTEQYMDEGRAEHLKYSVWKDLTGTEDERLFDQEAIGRFKRWETMERGLSGKETQGRIRQRIIEDYARIVPSRTAERGGGTYKQVYGERWDQYWRARMQGR